MRDFIDSVAAEYRRYKALAEAAIHQVADADLARRLSAEDNSIATIVWHIAGNLESRFRDFRTSDGEKPWRNREEEFDPREVTREALLGKWQAGWQVLQEALDGLRDADLGATVTIRQQPLRVHEALHRSLAHTAYHVGQIVYLAKSFRGQAWQSLSIPRGESAAYNRRPSKERPPA
jgi:uncharacterized damage-inducible protein DinB